MILAGDIGATKSLLALFAPGSEPRSPLVEKSYPSRDYSGLEAVVQVFLQEHSHPVSRACFGLPGPIVNDRCRTPNLPWEVAAGEIQAVLGENVALINDLEATGYGISLLHNDELVTLQEGDSNPQGNAALIAPGTGLGECILFWDGERHRPSASEGGHCDFAPRTAEQIAFLQWMHNQQRMPRVSFDRVATGSGLPRIYDFLRETANAAETAETAELIATAEDRAATISQMALSDRSRLCERTLDLWLEVLGAEAGNLALKALATAGVYIGGGIPPKILPKLQEGKFLEAFLDKGRLRPLVSRMPVKVILNERTALFGAACYAMKIAGEQNA